MHINTNVAAVQKFESEKTNDSPGADIIKYKIAKLLKIGKELKLMCGGISKEIHSEIDDIANISAKIKTVIGELNVQQNRRNE